MKYARMKIQIIRNNPNTNNTPPTTTNSNTKPPDEQNPQLADPIVVAKVSIFLLNKKNSIKSSINSYRYGNFLNHCSMKLNLLGYVVWHFNVWSSVLVEKYVIYIKLLIAQIIFVYIFLILIIVFQIQ